MFCHINQVYTNNTKINNQNNCILTFFVIFAQYQIIN